MGWRTPGKLVVSSCVLVLLTALSACKQNKTATPLFRVLNEETTGIHFQNKLTYNKNINVFNYIYFYNGSGVGAGDFNNDGLTDLFFGSNQGQNTLYLNEGGMHFKDVTVQAAIPVDHGWTTGISVVDINNDGLLDIYVCRVGNYEILKSRNQLLICQGLKNGVPYYKDQAAEYGLDFSGFSTQAAFFDYDMDGDLDMFLLNHSIHQNGTFAPRTNFIGTYHPLSGHRIFKNNLVEQTRTSTGKRGDTLFTDVTKQTGINSSAIGYGLGIAIADINLDGYPDIYIGNDFHENDYLYINQRNGTFLEQGEEKMMHTSQYSMGVDVADINNDAYPEIISMDMLPSDPYILKRSLGEDTYDIFHFKLKSGYSHQYTRNNLQYNRKNGMFSEIGLYSGIAATDWSWAPLWMDFDNDGWKDLFISNGIPKRMNDIDYINYVSSGEVQGKIRENNMEGKDMALISKFPEIKLPNRFYRNERNLHFADETGNVDGNTNTFSNGAVYADLDNDGDLDIVVNNIDDAAMIYENTKADTIQSSSIRIALEGTATNRNAVGARVIVYSNNGVRTYEKYAVKGFMSSMEVPLIIGTENARIDSALIIWPDNSYERLMLPTKSTTLKVRYKTGLSLFDYNRLIVPVTNIKPMEDISQSSGLLFNHTENHFVEFDRELLIPKMLSTEGPALAVGDVNNDGLEDVFIGGARDQKAGLFVQQAGGKFMKLQSAALDADSSFEDVSACWSDINKDGYTDLLVASGGNEFYGNDQHNAPRAYLNDGKGMLTRYDAFGNLNLTASVITCYDFNNDGYEDVFIGGRAVPYEYGKLPASYLLVNDKTGKFRPVTDQVAPGLSTVGFVTNGSWIDLDKDGDRDLVLSLEWGLPTVFINNKGKFSKQALVAEHGWWNFLTPVDIDNDGDIDLVAGNLGLNSRFVASADEPVRMYYNDFDGNGKKEQVLTYYLDHKEIPFANKAELDKQLPIIKKRYLYAGDFAKASLNEIFSAEKLEKADRFYADYFANAVLVNKGSLKFELRALPAEAQFSSLKDAVVTDANGDKFPDLITVGNFYENNMEMGRYDADYGTTLLNTGAGNFSAQPINGVVIKGEVRHIQGVRVQNFIAYVVARNNDSTLVVSYKK